MTYVVQTWHDKPAVDTPITAARLAHMEAGIAAAGAFFDRSSNAYNWKSSNTRLIRRGLGRVMAGKGSANFLVIGDSMSAGYLGSAETPSADTLSAWPEIMRAVLANRGITSGGTGVVPCIKGNLQYDSRWNIGSGWDLSLAYIAFTTSTNKVSTFVSDQPGTSVSVFFMGNSTAMKVNIDGGADHVLTFSNTNAPNVATFSGLADTVHTVVITTTAATYNALIGASVFTPGVGLHVHNIAVGGSYAHYPSGDFLASWDQVTPAHMNPVLCGSVAAAGITPDAVFVGLGGNDVQNASYSQAGTLAAIAGLRAQFSTSDFILIGETELSTHEAAGAALVAAEYTLADTLDVPLVDMLDRFGDYATMNGHGLIGGDGAHPTAVAQADWGRNMANLVMT
jgi:lysophospholipase L1-like esterase